MSNLERLAVACESLWYLWWLYTLSFNPDSFPDRAYAHKQSELHVASASLTTYAADEASRLRLKDFAHVPEVNFDGVVDLIHSQQYEHVLSQRLPLLARKSESPKGFGTNRMDFKKIWKARAGELDDSFVEERRSHFADAVLEQIERVKAEREGATDKRGFDHRLKILGDIRSKGASSSGRRCATAPRS